MHTSLYTHLLISILLIPSLLCEDYYLINRDTRRCAYPLCGGYWVKRANRKHTVCTDQSKQEKCYVTSIEGFKGTHAVIQGTLTSRDNGIYGPLGYLHASYIWTPIHTYDSYDTDDTYYVIEYSCRQCITDPCLNIIQMKLNSGAIKMLAGVSGELSGEILSVLNNPVGNRVIVAGKNVKQKDKQKKFTVVDVSAAYIPQVECKHDKECTVTSYHSFVTSSTECYCVLCPTLITSFSIAQTNYESWELHCKDLDMKCPVVRCRAPPSVSCSESYKCVERVGVF